MLTAIFIASMATSMLGVYIYPKSGQNASQQALAESECYSSAEQKTGVYPNGGAPTPQPGGGVRGAARGAAGGAAIGAIAGNAGAGAGAGAVAGAIRGRQITQAQAQGQHQQRMDTLRRAFSACMDAKGYSVK
jgi:hypothetical protein